MRIVVFEVEPHEALAFKSLETRNEIVSLAEPLSAANASIFSNAEIISTFIYSEVGRRVLEVLPALKMIATRSTGFDHIDIAYCAERAITVCNV